SNCGSSSTSIPNNTFGYGRIDAYAAVKKAIAMVSVNDVNGGTAAVNAFPNPFSSTIRFEFSNWKPGTLLELYSITGTIVMSKLWEGTPSKYEVDMADQASGAYFYRVSNGSESVNGKLFKVNN
ncbi:MAG TPA: T9SS type A sorting domain-containing protein, partial [Bacteroidia bacterium]|nr:T9SS type A sorting domain-containing protein [Bacteroidia bacterium]